MLRPMRMRCLAAGFLLALAACGSQPTDFPTSGTVPDEFAEACGKPGSEVTTARSRVVVKHVDCDLTGVVINNGSGGAAVPGRGEGVSGASSSGSVTIQVDGSTGDVTFTAGP